MPLPTIGMRIEPRRQVAFSVWNKKMSEDTTMPRWRPLTVKYALRWSLLLFCVIVWVSAIALLMR